MNFNIFVSPINLYVEATQVHDEKYGKHVDPIVHKLQEGEPRGRLNINGSTCLNLMCGVGTVKSNLIVDIGKYRAVKDVVDILSSWWISRQNSNVFNIDLLFQILVTLPCDLVILRREAHEDRYGGVITQYVVLM